MTQQRIKPLYRAAFDFHAEALSKLGTITQADFWTWFFDKAAYILAEHEDDRQTLQDFILMIHADCEHLEDKTNANDHEEGDEYQ